MRKIFLLTLVLLTINSWLVPAQNAINLSGTVVDEFDGPLVGVNIYLKDRPGVGTITDMEGKFHIKGAENDVLVASYLGYKNYQYRINLSQTVVTIKMEPDVQAIEETVIVGTGVTQRRISSVGAVTTVDVAQLQSPAVSIINTLGGVVPGIITTQASGEPGKNIAEFWIRGIGTFGANSSALVLIDGLEGDLSSIDPADVESFSVLKDASATAVYGVRGANGVVLVTTKRGVQDRLQITARTNLTVSHLKRMPDYLGAYEYAQLANEARVARGTTPLYNDLQLDVIKYQLDGELYPDVNWRKEILKPTSFRQNYYMSARGGGSVARYFVSLGASMESAAFRQDKSSKYSSNVGYNTYNFRANIDMNITTSTTLYFGVDGYLSSRKEPGVANTDYLWSSQAKLTPLTVPTTYSGGLLPAYGKDDEISPYVMINHMGFSTSDNFRGNYTLALNQDLSFITKGLHLRVQGAYTNETSYSESRTVTPDLYYGVGRAATGELLLVVKNNKSAVKFNKDQDQFRKYHLEANLNYEKIVNNLHRFSGLVYYYMSDDKSAAQAGDSMSAIPNRYQGLSSRVTYGFDDTYLIDVNFGYTGSENFQKGHRFGFFPSVAGGWIPTSYRIVQETLPWLDFFKIRASYGLVGNDRITNKRFPYLTLVNDGSAAGWGAGYAVEESQIGADNLQWEKAKKFDVGFEGKFLKNRIDFVVDIFKDQRDGIFQQRTQIPGIAGLVSMPYGNVGKMKSYGADGNISYSESIGKDVSFIVRANFTLSKNKVQNWEQADQKYPYMNLTGMPHDSQRGYIALGLFEDEDDVVNSPSQSGFGSYMPGDIKYKDVNGDGVIDSDDQVPLSYQNFPRLMYGFGGEFRYKKLKLGVLFRGTGNTDFYYVGKGNEMGYVPFYGENLGNVLTIVGDQSNRWTPASYSKKAETENPNARFPRLSYGKNENNSQLSDFWKGNSRYLRLQEINLSYNLGTPFLKKVGVSSLDIHLVGQNLHVWDKVKMWDPEQAEKNGQVYPIPATYTLQLYINF